MKKRATLIAIPALLMLIGCGVNDEKLEVANGRLAELTSKGLPDSLVSPAKVKLYETEESRKRSRNGQANNAFKEAITALDVAEAALEKAVTEKKPAVLADYSAKKEDATNTLKGLHLKAADSLLNVVDSLINIDFIYKAENKMIAVTELLPELKKQQKVADKLRPRIPGTWRYEAVASHAEDKSVNAVEKKTFSFYKNGKAKFVEQKKGKSSPFLKEDWLFITKGEWDLKGDTIHLLASQFACPRQKFTEKHIKDGKTVWENKNQPTYDSTITDGSQNRFITIQDLREDYKR
jgi:hypothetical protein